MTSNNSGRREKELTTPTDHDSEQSPSNQITLHDKAQDNMVNKPNKNTTTSTIKEEQKMRADACSKVVRLLLKYHIIEPSNSEFASMPFCVYRSQPPPSTRRRNEADLNASADVSPQHQPQNNNNQEDADDGPKSVRRIN